MQYDDKNPLDDYENADDIKATESFAFKKETTIEEKLNELATNLGDRVSLYLFVTHLLNFGRSPGPSELAERIKCQEVNGSMVYTCEGKRLLQVMQPKVMPNKEGTHSICVAVKLYVHGQSFTPGQLGLN